MRILVCHRQRALLALAKLQAERKGMQVTVAPDSASVVAMARVTKPSLIVLGNDLANPSTEDIIRELKTVPELKGVEVVIMKGAVPALGSPFDFLRRPRSSA